MTALDPQQPCTFVRGGERKTESEYELSAPGRRARSHHRSPQLMHAPVETVDAQASAEKPTHPHACRPPGHGRPPAERAAAKPDEPGSEPALTQGPKAAACSSAPHDTSPPEGPAHGHPWRQALHASSVPTRCPQSSPSNRDRGRVPPARFAQLQGSPRVRRDRAARQCHRPVGWPASSRALRPRRENRPPPWLRVSHGAGILSHLRTSAAPRASRPRPGHRLHPALWPP